MPKRLPTDLFERVEAAFAQHPRGLTLAGLQALLKDAVSRRSLQRYLQRWLARGTIRAEGVRRGRRYFSAAKPQSGTVVPSVGHSIAPIRSAFEESVALSTTGQEIQAFVHRPIVDRPPTGHQRVFLDHYAPNASAYLPNTLKTHLHELGRTSDGQRPAGTYARDILDRLLIDFSWSSSRLEGNTYSLLDTRELIEHGKAAPGKDAKETQMILNHKAAIELLVDSAEEIGVNRYTVTNLHALLADNLLEEPRNTGRLRETPVTIGASTYVPTAIPQLIDEMFTWMLQLGAAIHDPFEQSFFLLVHIPYLQPFVDVSKRTSRLASNIPLIKRNLVPLSFIDVPEQTYIDGLIGIYELNRVELLRDVFVWGYERSARRYKTIRDSLPQPDPLRLKYRTALTEAVGETVRRRLPATIDTLTQIARPLVPAEDLERFTHMALAALSGLHEGNIARFRLRPAEFRQWIGN